MAPKSPNDWLREENVPFVVAALLGIMPRPAVKAGVKAKAKAAGMPAPILAREAGDDHHEPPGGADLPPGHPVGPDDGGPPGNPAGPADVPPEMPSAKRTRTTTCSADQFTGGNSWDPPPNERHAEAEAGEIGTDENPHHAHSAFLARNRARWLLMADLEAEEVRVAREIEHRDWASTETARWNLVEAEWVSRGRQEAEICCRTVTGSATRTVLHPLH